FWIGAVTCGFTAASWRFTSGQLTPESHRPWFCGWFMCWSADAGAAKATPPTDTAPAVPAVAAITARRLMAVMGCAPIKSVLDDDRLGVLGRGDSRLDHGQAAQVVVAFAVRHLAGAQRVDEAGEHLGQPGELRGLRLDRQRLG